VRERAAQQVSDKRSRVRDLQKPPSMFTLSLTADFRISISTPSSATTTFHPGCQYRTNSWRRIGTMIRARLFTSRPSGASIDYLPPRTRFRDRSERAALDVARVAEMLRHRDEPGADKICELREHVIRLPYRLRSR
jgi:hypothetical protein